MQPLVLTSSQIAQLTQNGMLKMTSTTTNGTVTSIQRPVQQQSTMPPSQPIIIKTEPVMTTTANGTSNPLKTALPTVQTIAFNTSNGIQSIQPAPEIDVIVNI